MDWRISSAVASISTTRIRRLPFFRYSKTLDQSFAIAACIAHRLTKSVHDGSLSIPRYSYLSSHMLVVT